MTISTYTNLQTAFDNWLSHQLFQSVYPDFIALFEAFANRKLRVRQQLTSTNITMSSGDGTMPTDYLEFRRVTRLSSLPQDMEFVEPSYLQILYPNQIQTIYPPAYSVPSAFFTIENTTLKVRPIDDGSQVQLLYYAAIPALASSSTNWLLTAHPDLYLFGSLCEAEAYGVHDERMPMWKARRDEIVDEISKLYAASSSPSSMRVIGPTP